jgi:hypothetical protein
MTTLSHPGRHTIEVFTDENGRVFEWQVAGFNGPQVIVTECPCGCIQDTTIISLSLFADTWSSHNCKLKPEEWQRAFIRVPHELFLRARKAATRRNDQAATRRHAGGGSGADIPI